MSTRLQWLRRNLRLLMAPKLAEPSYPRLPRLNADGETSVSGIYVAGDLAGAALIKTSLNQGAAVVERIAARRDRRVEGEYDLVVIGTGAAGFAALVRARELGLRALGIDSGQFAESIRTMTRGKLLFAEPAQEAVRSSVWFEECTREELLERWNQQRQLLGLDVREFERVNDIRRDGEALVVTTSASTYRARAVVLAIGKAGTPRKAGVPGEQEHASRIAHFLPDAAEFSGRRILIYGGGDVAAEAALALADRNDVTLATIDERWIFPRKRNIDQLEQKRQAGRLKVLFSTRLSRVEAEDVELTAAGGETVRLANDFVFEMIGADLPVRFLKKLGVRLADEWTPLRYAGLTAALALMYLLYALKKHFWPFASFRFEQWAAAHHAFRWMLHLPSGLAPTEAPAFWYTALYSLLVVAFGLRAARRWGKSDAYQRWRYASFIAFQLGFFFIVDFGLARLIPKYYWRGWGLYQPFPLFFNTFFWWYPGDPAVIKWSFIGFGLLATFVLIPLFVRRHGMRFCTWICGCGALAETLGDAWREQSPKGLRSRLWEFQGPLVLIWAFVSLFAIVFAFRSQGNNTVWRSYDYIVDFWLVSVLPVGFYPFFGGKIWCRYWCPLAHYMKWLSARFGRLEITANERCIQCTLCAKYCMVGVDVMSFAKNGESFDNRNTSCVHCGICITVCPTDVLSFQVRGSGAQPGLVQIKEAV